MTTRARALQPRLRPKRRTGRAIVEAILEAATELVAEHGLSQSTTNAIAERAGVSVGSVYQYFPNKQAIVAALNRQVNERLAENMSAALEGPGSPEERLEAVLAVLCSPRIGAYAIRRMLLLEVPRSWEAASIRSTELLAGKLLLPLAHELAPLVDAHTVEQRLVLALYAVQGAVQGALLHEPALLDAPATRDALRDMVLVALGCRAAVR